jgi:integrase
MPRIAKTLTAKEVEKLRAEGLHAVGGVSGLCLKIVPPKARYWVLRATMPDGRRGEMGLGGFPTVGLAEAREAAREARQVIRAKADPIAASKAARSEARAARSAAEKKVVTFKDAAEAYIVFRSADWGNDKSDTSWSGSLARFAYPQIGSIPVADVGKAEVLAVLQPIWKIEAGGRLVTAQRLRGRMEKILDYAREQEWRPEGPNPAAWHGRLDQALTHPGKLRKKKPVKHHRSIPHAAIGDFMRDLRAVDSMGGRCLEFVTLTAVRSGEARGAVWAEIDLDQNVWTIPASRMKAGLEHRVPLSTQAVALLKALPRHADNDLVFPSPQGGRKLSDMTLLAVMKRMEVDAVPHGMRSTFRMWCGDCTNFPREVAEAALAHTLKDKTEAAYMRSDLLSVRVRLMQQWADFVGKPAVKGGGNVVAINAVVS